MHFSKRTFLLFSIVSLLIACTPKGVDQKEVENPEDYSSNSTPKEFHSQLVGVKDSAYRNPELLIPQTDQKFKREAYKNGITIEWVHEGKGNQLEANHAYKIAYEVLLDDGSVVDGNKIANRDWIHFLLGYQIQGEGWDFALSKLKIGDFAKIVIPSKLARGKVGIEGLIPPDANNTVTIKILDEIQPDKIVDGTKVWLLSSTPKQTKISDEASKITVDYTVSTPSNPRFLNTNFSSTPFIFSFQDKGIIQGLKKALLGVKRGDNLWVTVPSDQGYGKEGFTEMVKPNESLFYEVLVYEVE